MNTNAKPIRGDVPLGLMYQAVCTHCHRAIVRGPRGRWIHQASRTIACGQPEAA